MSRVRVASLQYFIRPVRSLDEFRGQVAALVETAADYKVRLLVFPEYFTTQMLTLGDVQRPIETQIRDLAHKVDAFVELMHGLARKHGIYIVAGSIPVLADDDEDVVYNRSYVFGPTGQLGVQGKMHMTRWEVEDYRVTPAERLHLFETDFGRMAVAICYDAEFPEIARAAARNGAEMLVVPSCTDERQGYLRVRYCAQARAIENSMYVVVSSTVGSLPMVPAVSLNYGQAAILTPSDFQFSRDGILAEGMPNQESMIIGDLNLSLINEARERGTVLPLRDSVRTSDLVRDLEIVTL